MSEIEERLKAMGLMKTPIDRKKPKKKVSRPTMGKHPQGPKRK